MNKISPTASTGTRGLSYLLLSFMYLAIFPMQIVCAHRTTEVEVLGKMRCKWHVMFVVLSGALQMQRSLASLKSYNSLQ